MEVIEYKTGYRRRQGWRRRAVTENVVSITPEE